MLNLAEKYWEWRESLDIKRQELEKELAFKKKYKKYFDKAKGLGSINKSSSKELTSLYIECIESGVSEVKKDAHRCWAEFNNGYKVVFWIANKMYAYAQDSKFTAPDGSEIDFQHVMPDKWCLFYILEQIEEKGKIIP